MVLLFILAAGDGRAAARPDPFFGTMSQTAMTKADFDRMEWGRIGSYRIAIDWGTVDPHTNGNMNWEAMDELVRITAERSIQLLPVLYGTPKWLAGDRRRIPVWSVTARRAWKRFLTQAVTRYGTRGTFWLDHPDVPFRPIRNWQIWNEPNIRYWAYPVSPRRYARLLHISSQVIRRIDRQARIVTAGFYARPPPGTGMPSWKYLNRLYRFRLFRRSFDIAAVHPYATSATLSLRRTIPVRRTMNRNRQRLKPLMITELGWGSDDATSFGMGSIASQGRELSAAYRKLIRNRHRLRLRGIYWFSWADVPTGTKACSFCRATGLFDEFGEPKPTWDRLLDFTHDR